MVVYGPEAPTREGDVDHVERLFISVPADMPDRLYLRSSIRSPPAPTTPATAAARTPTRDALPAVGRRRAPTAARPLPAAVEDGAPPAAPDPAYAGFAGGRVHRRAALRPGEPDRRRLGDAGAVHAPPTASVIDGRAYFRLDVIGEAGDYGNAFTVEASLSPDRSEPAPEVRLFAYQPTIRWREGERPDRGALHRARRGRRCGCRASTAPEGEIALVSTFGEAPLPASGQDEWRSPTSPRRAARPAITLRGGIESPNDVTLALFDAAGKPVALEMPPRTARRPQPRPVAVGAGAAARQLHLGRLRRLGLDRRRPARLPLALRRRRRERRSRCIAHRLRRAGPLRGGARGARPRRPRRARGARSRCRCTCAPAPVAAAGRSGDRGAGRAGGLRRRGLDRRATARSPASAGASATAPRPRARPRATPTQRPGLYRAVLRVEDDSGHPCDFGVATRLVTVNFPPVAEAGEARSAAVGEPVTLGGGASYDVDGSDRRPSLGHGRRHASRRRDRHPRLCRARAPTSRR